MTKQKNMPDKKTGKRTIFDLIILNIYEKKCIN